MLFIKSPGIRNLSHKLIQPASLNEGADLRKDRIWVTPISLNSSVDTHEYPLRLNLSPKTHAVQTACEPASISGLSRQTLTLPVVRTLALKAECNAVNAHWRKGDAFSSINPIMMRPEDYPVRIWWPMGISCFDHLFQRDGKQVREHALGLLSAPTLADANGHVRTLLRSRRSLPQTRVLEAVNCIAFGTSAEDLLWDTTEFIDALRLRHIRSKMSKQGPQLFEVSDMEWAGSLHWLGKHIDEAQPQLVNEKTRRIATTAVASVAGYRAAIEFLARVTPNNAPIKTMEFRWHSACALRALLEGGVNPEIAICLIPPSGSGNLCQSTPDWLAFKLAMLWISEQRQTNALVSILAELISTSFRNRLSSLQRRLFHTPGNLLPFDVAWSSSDYRQARSILSIIGDLNWNPWGNGYADLLRKHSAVDLQIIDADIRKLIAGRISILPYVYMNRFLLASAIFAIMGNDVSAATALAACGDAEIWIVPRKAMSDCIKLVQVRKDPRAYLSLFLLADPELSSLLRQIKETVEPNISLGTPIWSVEESLSKWAVRLIKTGKTTLFRQLRTLLSRRDLCEKLEPFMMLTQEYRASYEMFFGKLSECLPHKPEWFWREAFDTIAEHYSDRKWK